MLGSIPCTPTIHYEEIMSTEKKVPGLKLLTRKGSEPVRLAKGGKEYVRDSSKKRKYKVKGE